MATVIDALLVTLGLDATGFQNGADDTTKAQQKIAKESAKAIKEIEQQEKKQAAAQAARAKELEDRSKKIAQGFSKLRNEALGLLAIFTAGMGLKNFVENTINTAASLDRMSSNLGMSAKDLSMWQLAAKNAGGTADGMTSQLKKASSDIAALKLGQGVSESLQASFRFGINSSDLKDANTLILKQADILKKAYDVDPNKAMEMAKMMGISEDSFALLKQGSAAVQQQRKDQEALAEEMAKASKAAEELRKKIDSLKNKFESIAVTVLTQLMPVFDQMIVYFNQLGDWIVAHKQDIAEWVKEAVKAIKDFAKTLNDAADAVGGWKNVLIALLALKVLSFTANIVSLGAAFLSLGSALGVIGGASGLGALAVLGKLGLAGAAAWTALKVAKAMGLPDTDTDQGTKDIQNGDWLAASAHMPALDFLGAVADRLGGGTGIKNKQGVSGKITGVSPAIPAKADQLVQQLMKSGWSQAQASGIIANFMHESQLDPRAVGDGGSAYGIGQWHPDRQAEFKKKFGKDIRQSTVQEQVAFADYELRQGNETAAGRKLAMAMTASDAGAIVSKHYERPADKEGEAAKRAASAAALQASMQSRNALAAATAPTGASVSAPIANNSSNSTSTTDVKVGQINIHTQATDAAGIAKDMGGAITQFGFANQANTGLA